MSSEQTRKSEEELKKELEEEIRMVNEVLDWSIEVVKWIGGSNKTGEMYKLDCIKRERAVKDELNKEKIEMIKEAYIFAMKPEFRDKFLALIDEIAGLLEKFGTF